MSDKTDNIFDGLKLPKIGSLTDSDKHCIAVIGPFAGSPVFRCEYQFSGHSGIVSVINEDSDEDLEKVHEGSTSYAQFCYLNAIAGWFTETQQKFLETRDIKELSLHGESLPWNLDEFNKNLPEYEEFQNLLKRTWLVWSDKVLNLWLLFEDIPSLD